MVLEGASPAPDAKNKWHASSTKTTTGEGQTRMTFSVPAATTAAAVMLEYQV